MRTRQFKQLAGKGFKKRLPLLIEGLEAIATNVGHIASEFEVCDKAGAYRAAELLRNVGREEAGKYLILIDSCRAPGCKQATISRHFDRAGNHLAKLIYAQMADYAIASQKELLSAIDMHRQALHLDGPNDFDWIYPNELISERERAMYVDLVEWEGTLGWLSPLDDHMPLTLPRSMRLVAALSKTGIACADGMSILQDAWRGFDPSANTRCAEWAERSTSALENFAAHHDIDDGFGNAAGWVVELWPMPMVELDIAWMDVTAEELAKRRGELHERWMAREYGLGAEEGFDV